MSRIEPVSDFAPSPARPKEPSFTGSSRLPEVTRPEMDEGNPELVEAVYAALKSVRDPEIPVNLVDLGLIYEIAARKEVNGFVIGAAYGAVFYRSMTK